MVTSSGLLGKVFLVSDKVVTLELSPNAKVRVLKTSIQGRVTGLEESKKLDDGKKDDDKKDDAKGEK